MATVKDCDKLEGMTDVEDMITAKEAQRVAKEMGVGISLSYIARSAKNGRIPKSHKIGEGERAPWYIHKPSFLEWLKNRNPVGRPREDD